MCMSILCGYAPVSAGAHGSQKREPDPLELEFQVAVNYLLWVWDQTGVFCKSRPCS